MVFFFYGANSFASRKKLQELIATYLRKAGSDYGLERLDGAAINPKQLSAALQAVPFLASSRLVIVENYGRNKAAADGLEDLVKLVPDTTVVVFYEVEVDKRTVYFKVLSKLAKVQTFEQLTQPQLLTWADKELKRLGASADREALVQLVERCGGDQWRLATELEKLSTYAPKISREMVESMVEASFSETIFTLVEAITDGSISKASKLYTGLITARSNEIYILTMMTWQIRNLLMAKTAPPMSSAELAKATGMSPYVAGKMQAAAQAHEEEALKAMMLATIDTEYQIKSGAMPMNVAVEQLVLRLASQSVRHPA